MTYSKMLAWAVVAAGVMVTSVQAKAEDRDWARGDLHRDYARVNQLRNAIAAHRAELNEDLRCGRFAAAAEERRDIARDEARLNAQLRDIRHDRWDRR
jgi:hypothetical protein